MPDIDIALLNGVIRHLVDPSGFETNEGRLEQCFWYAESSAGR